MLNERTGIIDIGSGSVRLVIYERTASGAYRVIDGSKRSTRLSARVDSKGDLPLASLTDLLDTLRHFKRICRQHETTDLKAVATAAIRNAGNRTQILTEIQQQTGLQVELLSGEQEAAFGFLGMINSLSIRDGFLIDIGGGSTELSLFRNRELVSSFSFPFGCVSLHKRFAPSGKGQWSEDALLQMETFILKAVADQPWISQAKGLQIVGLGGTARALGKMVMEKNKYPFPLNHNYSVDLIECNQLLDTLRRLPQEKRSKQPGLSRDRVDVIIPGLTILRTLAQATKSTNYLICGTGLRDGLFHNLRYAIQPKLDDPLGFSVANLVRLYPEVPREHVEQVSRLSLQIFDALVVNTSNGSSTGTKPASQITSTHSQANVGSDQMRHLLIAASKLFRIGAAIDYYEFARHSFYLILNAQLSGVTHREIILIAAIASYKSKSRTRQQLSVYKELLLESDIDTIAKLGSVLQLAAALDRSQTQAINELRLSFDKNKLRLTAISPDNRLTIEQNELSEFTASFHKLWGISPELALE